MKNLFFFFFLLISISAQNDLTDEERKISEKYIHKGKQDRILEEERNKCLANVDCKNATEGTDAIQSTDFYGMAPEIIKGIIKSYSLFMTFGELSSNNTGLSSDEKKNKKNDYCKYIATVGESIALKMQKNSIQEINNTPSTNAKDVALNTLEKQQRLHQSRKEALKPQRNAWAVTSVCYVGHMALDPTLLRDWRTYAKMTGAALIAYYYTWEQEQHQKAVDQTSTVITNLKNRLGKERGNCNPMTERDCYCSEDSTKDDVKYCSNQLRPSLTENTQIPCLDVNGKQDNKCLCLKKNNCFDKNIIKHFENYNLTELQKNAIAPFLQNVRGRSIPGHHAESINKTSKKLFALNRKFLKDNLSSVKIPESKNGQEYQKNSNASLLAQAFGLNQRAGKLFALAGIDNSIRKEIDLSKSKNKKSRKSETRKARKRPVRAKYTKNRPKKNTKHIRKNLRKPIVKEKHSAEVLKFYSDAVKKAEIIRDKEVSIFLVIKTRYYKLMKRGAL